MEFKITIEKLTSGNIEAIRIGLVKGNKASEVWIRYENINGKIKCL